MRILSVNIQFFTESGKVTQKQFQDDSTPSVSSMEGYSIIENRTWWMPLTMAGELGVGGEGL